MNDLSFLKDIKLPSSQLSGSDLIALTIIGAIEVVMVTSIKEKYDVCFSIETTKAGVKGSVRLSVGT